LVQIRVASVALLKANSKVLNNEGGDGGDPTMTHRVTIQCTEEEER